MQNLYLLNTTAAVYAFSVLERSVVNSLARIFFRATVSHVRGFELNSVRLDEPKSVYG